MQLAGGEGRLRNKKVEVLLRFNVLLSQVARKIYE